jgi:hypothetical protein
MRNATWVLLLLCTAGAAFVGGSYVRRDTETPIQHAAQQADEQHRDAAVGHDELVSTLATRDFDRTILVMNRVKGMRYQADVLPLLSEAWQLNLMNLPRVDRAFLAHPRIRIELADVLLQASRNGAAALQPDEYISYARQNATSSDRDVAREAILVLGVAREPADLPLLTDILNSENEATFRAAAISFVQNCAVDDARITSTADRLRSRALQEYLRELWRGELKFRAQMCKH